MNLGTLLDALIAGGRTALVCSAAGHGILVVYSLSASQKVIYLPFAVLVVAIVSILSGAVRGGMTAHTSGGLHGLAVAALYVVLVQSVKLAAFSTSALTSAGFALSAGLLLTGYIGGVAGINLKYVRRSRQKRRYLGI